MSRTLSGGAGDRRQLDLFAAVVAPAMSETVTEAPYPVARLADPMPSAADQPARTSPAVITAALMSTSKPPAGVHKSSPATGSSQLVWKADRAIRTLSAKDMPAYPPEMVAAAARTIKEAPTNRVLLTYKEIDAFFGVSRATVARRLKDGKVPGIRLKHGRVLEDGPVRRLDRTQLLYLLLSVRSGRA